ncbi:hypothetical protein XBJ1_3531 [Xenorhabdus bovienii SS-2004]|uniref:Uncharacterized protein n=1 Tax=Xenorhabdus bovienii (strain SS-2004) TaxID=406818 RepID=D3V4S0_XENBS|nr:hypothetical protein XBJ1_3531 [Xenorhabdus bovienii SS-2004]
MRIGTIKATFLNADLLPPFIISSEFGINTEFRWSYFLFFLHNPLFLQINDCVFLSSHHLLLNPDVAVCE